MLYLSLIVFFLFTHLLVNSLALYKKVRYCIGSRHFVEIVNLANIHISLYILQKTLLFYLTYHFLPATHLWEENGKGSLRFPAANAVFFDEHHHCFVKPKK